ncbi:MAG: hypothetical protein FJ290_22010 [Planctomycetes bacterium]|nr:hypothetical protein [Planctomycetota bacterium]
MSPIKESLLEAVRGLSDEEAKRALVYVQSLHEGSALARLRARLAGHPAITLPAVDEIAFRDVEPIEGKGILASELLVRERR